MRLCIYSALRGAGFNQQATIILRKASVYHVSVDSSA